MKEICLIICLILFSVSFLKIKDRKVKLRWKRILAGMNTLTQKNKAYAYWFLGILSLGILFISFCSFFYGDIECTFDNTVLLAKAIKEGEFFHFYEYSLVHAQTYWPAGYDILLYLFFAVWNLPFILWHLISGFAYLDSPVALLWCKGLTVLFAAGMALVLYRIVRLLHFEKAKGILAVFLMLTSMSLVAPVFIAGQYDTLPLFFMLLGLYFYLKEKPKYFYLCFLVSIPLKVYGLFLLLPLVLLKEKRIWAIFMKTAGCCSLYAALKLLFAGDSAYPFISGSQGAYGTGKLINAAAEYSGYSLCLFIGVYAAVCIYCYWKKLANEQEALIYPVYICFLIFASFVTLVAINDYWIIFYLPFAVLLMIINDRNYKINVLIETVSSGMYLLYAFINKIYPYSYPGLVTERFMRIFIKVPDDSQKLYGSVKNMMEALGLSPYAQVVHTLFVVGMISLIVINRPSLIMKTADDEPDKIKCSYGEQGILWCRTLVMGFSILLLLYANLKSGSPVLYSTLDGENERPVENLIEGSVYTQDLQFENSGKLSELTINFENTGYVKDNFGSVWIRITEKESGTLLFEKRVGASMAEGGKPYRISLAGIDVEEEMIYTLSLQGVTGMESNDFFFAPWITDGFEKGFPLIIDGEYQDCNLYMQIR